LRICAWHDGCSRVESTVGVVIYATIIPLK
jgi:hypothetical protein